MAEICRQINIEVADAVGKLAEVTEKVKDAGVNIYALAAWTEGGEGHLMMVTEDAEKACEAVTPAVDKCSLSEVVCVKLPNRPGELSAVARKLADAGINIKMAYASAGHAEEATVVLDTSDNAKAAELV